MQLEQIEAIQRALPETARARAKPNLRAAYSDRSALLMASLSEAAYAPFHTEEGEAELRDTLREFDFELVQTYHGQQSVQRSKRRIAEKAKAAGPDSRSMMRVVDRGTEAYLCKNEEMAVLVFRGTTDGTDWKTNFNVRKRRISAGVYEGEETHVKVHSGFYDAFMQHANAIKSDLDALPKDLPIFFTGHSLGGALAQLATARFQSDQVAACYTFGSPRAGDITLDGYVKPPHYRVTNGWDIVPFIPFFLLGYRHCGDTRSVVRTPPDLLRRSRGVTKQWVIVLLGAMFTVALKLIPFTQRSRFVLIADHSISLYVERLTELVKRRSTLSRHYRKPKKMLKKQG